LRGGDDRRRAGRAGGRGRDDPAHPLLDHVDRLLEGRFRCIDVGGPRPFRDVDRAAANDRATACACAEFRQGHPNRHRNSLFLRLALAGKSTRRRWNHPKPMLAGTVNAEDTDISKAVNYNI
jgi:hypothetical protein